MKLAYITQDPQTNTKSWSGLTHYIGKALQNAGADLMNIHTFEYKTPLLMQVQQKLYPKLYGRFIQPNRHASVLKPVANTIDVRLSQITSVEAILSNSTELVAYLQCHLPTFVWIDATFAAMQSYYPEFKLVHPSSLRAGHNTELRAFNKCAGIFTASHWAAASVINDYGMDPNKVHVIPFGANLNQAPTAEAISVILQNRSNSQCNLLFSGVYWERKGGPKTVQILQALQKAGIPSTLHIVGCAPYAAHEIPEGVIQYGFLDKTHPAQATTLQKLFETCHFLVMPSEAECYGLVYCEANAFAMPAIGLRTGGVPTIIEHGNNGGLFEPDASADTIAAFIASSWQQAQVYQEIALRSYEAFQTQGNWQVAGAKAFKIISDHCSHAS